MKTTLPVRTDPDFIPNASNTIDIRKYFQSEELKKVEDWEEAQYVETEDAEPFVPELIVAPSHRAEEKRKQERQMRREEKEYWQAWKFGIFRILLSLFKTILVFSIERFQWLEKKLRALEQGGINFDRKYSERTIFFLSISLPETIRTVEEIMLIMPLIPRKVAYQMLKIRKEKLAMYNRVFNK